MVHQPNITHLRYLRYILKIYHSFLKTDLDQSYSFFSFLWFQWISQFRNFYASSNQRNGNMLLAGFSKSLSLSLSWKGLALTTEVILGEENMWAPHLLEWSQWSLLRGRNWGEREREDPWPDRYEEFVLKCYYNHL